MAHVKKFVLKKLIINDYSPSQIINHFTKIIYPRVLVYYLFF